MAPMGQGTYGSQKGRPKKKKRPSEARTGSFPTPPKPKAPKAPKARTGSFPMKPKPAPAAGAMRAATMALLKKKKKK